MSVGKLAFFRRRLSSRGLNFIRPGVTFLAYVGLSGLAGTGSRNRRRNLRENAVKVETCLAYRSTISWYAIIAWQVRIKIAHGYPFPLSLGCRGWGRVIKSFVQSFESAKSFFRTYLRYRGEIPPTNNDIPGRVTYRALISSQLITGRKVGVAGKFASTCSALRESFDYFFG